MSRFRDKLKVSRILVAVSVTVVAVQFTLSVPSANAFYTQRQRYASRMLKITPKSCTSPDHPDVTGICMISLECQQRSGTVIGACRDGHLFGACCHDPQGGQLKSSMVTEAPTTTTTTTETTFPATGSGSSQQENNEVIPMSIDSEAQLDSQTQIPSLIDTFSELSPTFLSELALDEHTTGMYSLPQEETDEVNEEDKEQQFLLQRQKMEEILAETSSASNMISTEDRTTTSTDRSPRTSTSTEKYHGLEEIGGIRGGPMEIDEDFKDNMIKYIDEIVTMRNTHPTTEPEEVKIEEEPTSPPPPPPPPPAVAAAILPVKIPPSVEEDMPFSTFTIVTSTKPAEDGGEIHISSISTTGSGDTMLPTTTTPVPTPASEETVSVSVAQSIAALSSTESNEIRDTTEQTQMTSVQPTKFTFSKLKYSPKPYQPRSTTEKVVWTRPTVSTAAPYYHDHKVVDLEEDEDEEEEEEEDDHEQNDKVLDVSSSTQATSMEQTTMASSTEGYSSSYGYYSDDNVEEHSYNGGILETSTSQQQPYDYSNYYYSSSSNGYYPMASTSTSSLPEVEENAMPAATEYFNFDWTSPTIMSLLKGASEAAVLYYANQQNASERSDLNLQQSYGGSTTENELDGGPMPSSLPSSSSTTWRTTGYSSTSGAPSTPNTMSTVPDTLKTTSEAMSTRKTTNGPPRGANWDSSIDSFVDQVVDGIVHDLNKSDKIDDMIFSKQQQRSSVPTTKTPELSSTSTLQMASSTEKSKSSEKRKFKKTPRPKGKVKGSTEKSSTEATTEKQRMKKVTTKSPIQTKKRVNKNKTKPVKKVTTSEIKSANSTRKRLDYRKDCGVRPLIKKGRIVGGTPSTFGSWPWHALVKETVWWGIFSKIKCGGVLIGAQHVLTAAHCQPQQTGTLSVVLGITDSDDSDARAVTKQVKRVIPHPQFNARTYENDIMILELDSPVDFQPHVVPICLPKDDDELEGKTAYVTGMGLLKHDGERPLVLQEVDLPILNNTECQKMFVRSGNMKPIIDSFICAGYEQGRKDSCGGDSGGPLSVKRSNGQWVLAGTVSHGIKCALPDQPGVYMRTSYYKPWIDRVLNVARSRYRGIPRCNAPPLICARQRQHQQQLRHHHHQPRQDGGFVNTLFRIFRLARKMVDEGRKSG